MYYVFKCWTKRIKTILTWCVKQCLTWNSFWERPLYCRWHVGTLILGAFWVMRTDSRAFLLCWIDTWTVVEARVDVSPEEGQQNNNIATVEQRKSNSAAAMEQRCSNGAATGLIRQNLKLERSSEQRLLACGGDHGNLILSRGPNESGAGHVRKEAITTP